MNITIPPQHQIVLDNLSKSHQVGGRKAVHDLYKACASALYNIEGFAANVGIWKMETDALKIAVATDMTTGVYVQLSKANGADHSLMTVGKKMAMETSDPVTSSRNTRVFA